MVWNSDFLLRRFLSEHPSTALEHDSSEPQEELMANPNLQDLPQPAIERGLQAGEQGNPFWSERIREEFQLRQMRPDHLPPPLHPDPWKALDNQGGSSEGAAVTESLHVTARELDRQT